MAKGYIIVQSVNRQMVYNQNFGWVDRDAGPGPTVFPPGAEEKQLEPGQEWEAHNDEA